MAQIAELDAAPDTIEATLNYIVDDGTKVFTIVAAPGGSDTRSGGTPDPHEVQIHNGRPHADDFALDRNGFRFLRHDTKVADFYDEDEIKRVYYPEMVELIKAESGAKRVVVFDHTLRTADPHRVKIHNGRPHVKEFDLETNGFRFVDHDTKVKDFYDEDEI